MSSSRLLFLRLVVTMPGLRHRARALTRWSELEPAHRRAQTAPPAGPEPRPIRSQGHGHQGRWTRLGRRRTVPRRQ
ncbi:Uncharacterized protein HZ326_31747 [Fusarium oxysporum f. sp. albedinis]|nr:Uncharacterized protein HZ326_31747 [Fusarium oxysporum f. sp. albedinis]